MGQVLKALPNAKEKAGKAEGINVSKATPRSTSKIFTSKTGSRSAINFSATDDNQLLTIINSVRAGISYTDFAGIALATPFTLTDWSSFLQLSERTLHRNQKEKRPFQPIQAERIIELAMLYEYGVTVFGDKTNFNTWLTTPCIPLGSYLPKALLDTRFGLTMVRDELGRIEHGVLA